MKTDELRQAAELIKGHAWLERFRQGNNSLSANAAKDIAGYVDAFIRLVEAEHPPDDGEPLTREWFHSLGFVDVPSDMGPTYSDHVRRGRLEFWDFNGQCWLCQEADSFDLTTRGQVRKLIAALEGK